MSDAAYSYINRDSAVTARSMRPVVTLAKCPVLLPKDCIERLFQKDAKPFILPPMENTQDSASWSMCDNMRRNDLRRAGMLKHLNKHNRGLLALFSKKWEKDVPCAQVKENL